MTAITSKDWTLAKRPVGEPQTDDFAMVSNDAPAPEAGQIQVQNSWMSVDPYMRGRMYDRESYVPPFQIGEVLQGGAVGRVTASNHPDYAIGDLVQSMAGWREAWTAAPEIVMAQKLPGDTGLPDSAFLGIAGMPGLTAYGGEEKCALVKSLGADACVDYRAAGDYQGLLAALRAAAPKGIDVYFDNVGGDHFQAAIECARPFARMAICGMISQYNDTEPRPGPNNVIQIVGKQLQIRGFIVSTHADMLPARLVSARRLAPICFRLYLQARLAIGGDCRSFVGNRWRHGCRTRSRSLGPQTQRAGSGPLFW